MAKARALGPGFYSWLRFATGPLLWRHDYLLSDDVNQTAIDYASRTAAYLNKQIGCAQKRKYCWAVLPQWAR